ncbi:hypothetical protein EUGRSUZ_K00201 [Eucalyptus grandis]|uniref:MADS-box domain-containing protein n=4 Tax=Eucalyptus grandis TaxID=71139 RepID=A0A058ZZ44_EUCGR|nr:hypothetical protein EUGRSUZ_K00201 [Eucalyptus grandis]KAK3403820.1 hypothetical protein EUGRSUZ_K00201 [Eucalyptus grandis]KAK3403821.1 hypothetical protein EUGRSUZ_K00201 [Eucalyptus grandis]
MARGKVQMRRIENTTSQQVTFSKRWTGLLKKVYELSVLGNAKVAVIIFSQKGRLHEFSSNSKIRKTIDRYCRSTNDAATYQANMEQYILDGTYKKVYIQTQMEAIRTMSWILLNRRNPTDGGSARAKSEQH